MTAIFNMGELASYLRIPLAELETGTAGLLLQLATGEIVDVTGTLPDPIPVKVKGIALEVVARAYRNPEGFTSISEAIDDYTETRRVDRRTLGSGIYLTADEIARLTAALLPNTAPASPMMSVRLGTPYGFPYSTRCGY